MATFEISTPDQVRNDPLAMKFLAEAANGFGGTINVENILNNYDEKHGLLIIVNIEDHTIGAIYLTFTFQENVKVMTSVLLGGDRFNEWTSQLSDFYYKTAADNNCSEFMLMGRKGFKKYFPELQEVATVFRVSLI